LSVQLDKLQAVVSRRVGRSIDRLDTEQILPIQKKVIAYRKLIDSLEKDQAKVGFLEGRFLGDTIIKDIKDVKKLLEPLEKQYRELREKRSSLIKDYMGFVSYLSSGRETIQKLSSALPPSVKITLTPQPVRNLQAAFAGVDSLLASFQKQAITIHKRDLLKPAENNSKLTKSLVKGIDEDFNKLNMLGKIFAGDVGKDAREMSKSVSRDYAQILEKHKKIIDEFKNFATTMKAASNEFQKGQPISFVISVPGVRGTSAPSVRNINVKIDISEKGIIRRLGLDVEVMKVGQFTRSNEGTPRSERRIHWPRYNSGVTLAGGYDIGHKNEATVRRDLNFVNKGLRLVGKPEIPEKIIDSLIGGIGLKAGHAKRYLAAHPELKAYRLPKEAVDILFYKYFRREYKTAERVLNKNIQPFKFEDLPLDVRRLIADTVTRGDFLSLRNRNKRAIFYGSVKEGARTGDWSSFAEIYTDRKVFTLNPTINRHDQRAEKAEEIERRLARKN
jgi:hypothetical protein